MPKKQAHPKPAKRKSARPPVQKASPQSLRRKETIESEVPVARAETRVNPPAPERSKSAKETGSKRGNLPAEAAMSFLRDTKGLVNWSLRDMVQTLNISREEAERAVALLQIQGYVQPAADKSGDWITTPSGETVSGAKPPRFERSTVEAAVASLKQRIEEMNRDRAAKFEITRAVAFGDFLSKDRARVQAADVGVELVRKDRERPDDEIAVAHSAVEAGEEQRFLRGLRGRSALINLKPYAEWMGTRTHEKLL
jgi:hypothetical protein